MFKRLIMMSALLVMLGACSSTDKEMRDGQAGIDLERREGITRGSASSEVYGEDLTAVESVGLGNGIGTQADFIANVGDRVFFGYDRYDLNTEARMLLERQAAWLAQYPNLSLTIEGHADERGTREYNLALGERRANSVKNYLVAYGIDPRRVITISYGKERPSAAASNSSAWAQNRRAVTVVE